MKAVVRLVLLTALRDRLITGMAVLLAAALCVSIFLGGAALSEQWQGSLSFAAATGRLILVLGLTVFAAFHIQSLIETREVEAILARAISRAEFVLAYWLGLSAMAIVLGGTYALVIIAVTGATPGVLAWAATLIAEAAIVMAVVLFAGLMLERATPTVMFTLGFYALARLIGFFAGIRDTVDTTPVMVWIKRGFDVALLFVPRLDLFAQSRWVVYANLPVELGPLLPEAVLFVALVLCAAVFDLRRKQF